MLIELISSINNEPRRYSFDCLPGEAIYEAAERAAIRLPISCKNGVCHICRAKLVSGEVTTGTGANKRNVSVQSPSVESDALVADTSDVEIMLCKTWPERSCEIEVRNIYAPGELPLKNVTCQVSSVEVIKGHVYQVELRLPAGKAPEFFAGQYLSLNLPGREDPAFFSIASRPGLRMLTLHIQADPHLTSALEVIQFLEDKARENSLVSISLPNGEACLTKTPQQPLILMAAGTGFAQMKSVIEHLLHLGFSYPVTLYWGVRKPEDLYLESLAEQWQQQYSNFKFRSLIADIENIQENAHHNQLSDAVLEDHPELENSLVFVSGSPKLVFSAMDALTEAGLPEDQFFSDVLAYASRG